METADKFILHCMVCSLGGEHCGEHTKIAAIDEEALKLPLDSSMFSSFWPERGLPAPWQPGLDWLGMKCPRCGRLPWTFMPDDTAKLMEQGGPDWIRTSKGFVKLTAEGWEPEGEVVDVLVEDTSDTVTISVIHEAVLLGSNRKAYGVMADLSDHLQCPHCDYTGKTERGLKMHIAKMHGKGK